METSEILARHHRRVVDLFIESVLDELDLGDLERNVMGLAIREEVETGLVPGLTAVLSLLLDADVETLGRLPGWLECASAAMPAEVEFLAEMGRCLGPVGYDVSSDNLGLRPGESEVRRSFEGWMWEISPTLNRSD